MKIRILVAAALWVTTPALALAADENSSRPNCDSCEHGGPYVDIADIIARVAKKTGKQFLVDPRTRAEVATGNLDLARVDYPQLLSILRENMFVAYESGGYINVVPDANMRQVPMPVVTSVAARTPDDEVVTVLLQGKNVCAAWTVPVLRPLMPQSAHLAAMPQSNSLLIVDRAAGARRIVDLFERMDKQSPETKQPCPEWKTSESK
jgi:general secretion pathway protein D